MNFDLKYCRNFGCNRNITWWASKKWESPSSV